MRFLLDFLGAGLIVAGLVLLMLACYAVGYAAGHSDGWADHELGPKP